MRTQFCRMLTSKSVEKTPILSACEGALYPESGQIGTFATEATTRKQTHTHTHTRVEKTHDGSLYAPTNTRKHAQTMVRACAHT